MRSLTKFDSIQIFAIKRDSLMMSRLLRECRCSYYVDFALWRSSWMVTFCFVCFVNRLHLFSNCFCLVIPLSVFFWSSILLACTALRVLLSFRSFNNYLGGDCVVILLVSLALSFPSCSQSWFPTSFCCALAHRICDPKL